MGATTELLITDAYRRLNRELHERTRYGVFGGRWSERVVAVMRDHRCCTVLDYGCGRGMLKTALGFDIAEYDPAIAGKGASPEPADLVVCTDVLEHIEPELLDNVVRDLSRVTAKMLLFSISTRAAGKTLADGRNAHLIIEPAEWWRARLFRSFEILEWQVEAEEVNGLASPRRTTNGSSPDPNSTSAV